MTWGIHSDPKECGRRGGKAARGERKASAKLTPRDIQEILASAEPSTHIAGRYGVSSSTIRKARSKTTWAHIDD